MKAVYALALLSIAFSASSVAQDFTNESYPTNEVPWARSPAGQQLKARLKQIDCRAPVSFTNNFSGRIWFTIHCTNEVERLRVREALVDLVGSATSTKEPPTVSVVIPFNGAVKLTPLTTDEIRERIEREQAEKVRVNREMAVASQMAQSRATVGPIIYLTGRALQKITDGLLVEARFSELPSDLPLAVGTQLNPGAIYPQLSGEVLVLLMGSAAIDGDFLNNVRCRQCQGAYAYTTALGATKTIRQYVCE